MKKVVIVAPSFAPSSYPPAIRTRFFASYLPEFGWQPIVLTVKPKFLEEPQDSEFLKLLPKNLEIIRTPAIPQRMTRLFGFGDLGLRSFPFHMRELMHLCKKGVDAIVIPGPPWYPFYLGPLIAKRYGVPYVLDYIDPWINILGKEAPLFSKAKAAYYIAKVLERSSVINAAAIMSVSDGINRDIQKHYPKIPQNRFTTIPYGFDANDFDKIREQKQISSYLIPFSDYINLCYVGAALPKGKSTIRILFRAIHQLREFSETARRIRLHFFGTTYATGKDVRPLILPIANEEGIADIVSEYPVRIKYLDALKVLLSADLLLVLGSSEPHYVASKVFPNLLAQRPLLAIFHEASSVCAIIRDSGVGKLITYNDQQTVETKTALIIEALREFLAGDTFGIHGAKFEKLMQDFSAREMTKKLASILDRL